MGMIITTGTDTLDSDGSNAWIYDPAVTDGEDFGLSWSGSAMKVMDTLNAMGVVTDETSFEYGATWPLAEAESALEKAMVEADDDDDYLVPLLVKTKIIIANGKARGATVLCAC